MELSSVIITCTSVPPVNSIDAIATANYQLQGAGPNGIFADGDDVKVGQPVVEGARIVAKIAEQGKAKKVLVFKKKKRKGYRVRNGHRQLFTALSIEEITA